MSADTPVPPSERDAPAPADPNTRAAADPPRAADTPAQEASADPAGTRYLEVANSPEFDTLRRTMRRFVFPLAGAFLIWYSLYVLLSAFARDFMSTKVVGNINVALVFGLLQFVTTFAIAWWYARYADRRIDPLSAQLKASVENGADR